LPFDSEAYGADVAAILKLGPEEARPLLKRQKAADLFPHARSPKGALGGLFLYFSYAEDCHKLVQSLNSSEGDFWHGIVHREEPDAANAAYWFRQAGKHPVFPDLARAAEEIAAKYPAANFRSGAEWDPFYFIEFSERARSEPGSAVEAAAQDIKQAEWQILFDYCARSRS
jgi:hypothetical protein